MGLPWIQVAKEFPHSQEAIELAAELKLPRPHAVGLAVGFWAWAADAAPDGIIRGAETARAVLVVDEAARHIGFANAMIKVGLLEAVSDGLRICGWDRYAKALEKGAKDAARKRERRASGAETARVRRASGAGKSQSQMETESLRAPPDPQRSGPDPRHAPLVKALTDEARRHDPGWAFNGGRDAKVVTALLGKGEPPEVLSRWRRAWAKDAYPLVRTLSELNDKWGHFGRDSPGRAPHGAARESEKFPASDEVHEWARSG